jgi:hypothetical protein
MRLDRWSARADKAARLVFFIVGLVSFLLLVLISFSKADTPLWGYVGLGALMFGCWWASWFAGPKLREALAHFLPWL